MKGKGKGAREREREEKGKEREERKEERKKKRKRIISPKHCNLKRRSKSTQPKISEKKCYRSMSEINSIKYIISLDSVMFKVFVSFLKFVIYYFFSHSK